MPAERRWSKFWWQDWQREPSLRMCSMAARGLWMELLCLAHDGQPYGHITVNGRAPTPKQIAGIASAPEKEVSAWLRELEDAGVFSRTDDGVIFCRRMLRDREASEAGREAIGKRWGNNTPAMKEPNRKGKRKPNSTPNRDGNRKPTGDPNSLEAEADSEAESPQPPLPGGPPPDPHNCIEDGTGREIVGGHYWRPVWGMVCDAARIGEERENSDAAPVRRWLQAGIPPDDFLPVLRKCAARAGYEPPRTLAYFDRAVMEKRRETAQ